jgi:hypothetical protein
MDRNCAQVLHGRLQGLGQLLKPSLIIGELAQIHGLGFTMTGRNIQMFSTDIDANMQNGHGNLTSSTDFVAANKCWDYWLPGIRALKPSILYAFPACDLSTDGHGSPGASCNGLVDVDMRAILIDLFYRSEGGPIYVTGYWPRGVASLALAYYHDTRGVWHTPDRWGAPACAPIP